MGIAAVKLKEGFAAGGGNVGVLVEEIQERDDVLNSLSSERTQVPRAQFAGSHYRRLDSAANDFGGLASAPQIRAVDDINRVLGEPLRGLRGFFKSLIVQWNVQPRAQPLIVSWTIQRRVS